MNKSMLIKLAEALHDANIDVARPVEWDRDAEEIGIYDRWYFVVAYPKSGSVGGKIMYLGEAFHRFIDHYVNRENPQLYRELQREMERFISGNGDPVNDMDILKAMTAVRPPINQTLLRRWRQQARTDLAKSIINEWIEVLNGNKDYMDIDVFNAAYKKVRDDVEQTTEKA